MSLGNFIVKGNLVTSTGVTVDGDYNSLINKPTIPSTLTDLGISDGTAGQVLTTNGSGSFTFTTGAVALTDLSVTVTSPGTANLSYNNTSGVFTYTPPNLSGYLTSYTETDPVFTAHTSASITDGTGLLKNDGAGNWSYDNNTYLTSETVTSLSLATNTLTYTDENGSATNIDLSLYLDDTNLARLTSGTLDGATGIATFTRDDASTFTVDFSDLLNITFADLSVTQAAASGNGTLTYNNTNGVFTYTPPDLSGYLTSYTETDTLATVTARGATTSADITFSGNVSFGDNNTLQLGDSADLKIYHSGFHSYVSNQGTGRIYIQGDELWLGSWTTFERYLTAFDNGAVDLYYDNFARLSTTNTGVNVVGTITSDGLTVDGDTTITGTTTLQKTTEVLTQITGATGVVTHDTNNGLIFYHTSPSTNFTANFTNVATTNSRVTSVVLIIFQGATARIPTAVQVNGLTTTIRWQGGSAPTGTANGEDIISFSLVRNPFGSWIVFGSLTGY